MQYILKPAMHSWRVASVFKNTGIGYRKKQSVVTIHFNLSKKAKNVWDAKKDNFHFCVFKVLQCIGLIARKSDFVLMPTTKVQIRLHRCTCWFAPLLFPFLKEKYLYLHHEKIPYKR